MVSDHAVAMLQAHARAAHAPQYRTSSQTIRALAHVVMAAPHRRHAPHSAPTLRLTVLSAALPPVHSTTAAHHAALSAAARQAALSAAAHQVALSATARQAVLSVAHATRRVAVRQAVHMVAVSEAADNIYD